MKKRKYSKEKINKICKRIKMHFLIEDKSIEQIAQEVHAIEPTASPSGNNLSKKLNKGTITAIEEDEIADILGYDIVWVKRK